MKKNGFITNKFVLSMLVLLCLFIADIILHRGMSRVIIPASFPEQIHPVSLPRCTAPLMPSEKYWIKAVNGPALMQTINTPVAGIEWDVHADDSGRLVVYQDTAFNNFIGLDSLLQIYFSRKLNANTWLDLKNLSPQNAGNILSQVKIWREQYGLRDKMIIGGKDAKSLKLFCDNGFYTSYEVPVVDPYKSSDELVTKFADSVRNMLRTYPASSISGLYYQYPALKKFFPNYPILTWLDEEPVGIVSYFFKRQLERDENILVILSPFKK